MTSKSTISVDQLTNQNTQKDFYKIHNYQSDNNNI